MDEWRNAVLRSAQQKGGAPEAERPGHSPDETSAAGGSAKLFWTALGMLVFFVFVEGADMMRQRVAEEQAGVLQQSAAEPPAPDIQSGAGIDAQFQHADIDASGGLSREEVTAHLPQLADKFDEIDADRDGLITIQELQSYWQRING